MKHDNPCLGCPEARREPGKGCGKHSSCSKYQEYFNRRRNEYEKKKKVAVVNSYTKDAIERVKRGQSCTLQKYRTKGDNK